jgi:hypothetical protein
MGMKDQILDVIGEWIGICNDDINHNLDRLLEEQVRDLKARLPASTMLPPGA